MNIHRDTIYFFITLIFASDSFDLFSPFIRFSALAPCRLVRFCMLLRILFALAQASNMRTKRS